MKNTKMYYYNYLDMLKIASNIPILSDVYKVENLRLLDLIFLIQKVESEIGKIRDLNYLGKEFMYSHDGSLVCYRKNLLTNFIICIRNLLGSPTELIMSTNFKHLKIPLRDLPNISHMLNSLLMLKLIRLGFVYAHMALLSSPYGGIGITRYPDVGKTATTVLLSKKGFKALADDISLVNSNADCYGEGIGSISIHAVAEYITAQEMKPTKNVKIRYKIGEPLRLLSFLIPPSFKNLSKTFNN